MQKLKKKWKNKIKKINSILESKFVGVEGNEKKINKKCKYNNGR